MLSLHHGKNENYGICYMEVANVLNNFAEGRTILSGLS